MKLRAVRRGLSWLVSQMHELWGVTCWAWDPDLWRRTAGGWDWQDGKCDETGSFHTERTNGTLDPAVALGRNNCYGVNCLGDTTGNREQKGSPLEAGRNEDIPSSSSRLAVSFWHRHWWSLTWSQLTQPKCGLHSPSPSRQYKTEY